MVINFREISRIGINSYFYFRRTKNNLLVSKQCLFGSVMYKNIYVYVGVVYWPFA